MFQVGDKIVHPMHGAGVIDNIVEKKFNGVMRSYYRLKLPLGGMLVMIPMDSCDEIGIRRVVDYDEGSRVLDSLDQIEVEMDINWSRRHRDNMMRMKSGDLYEVAWVVKGLVLRDLVRRLSTGERKMLHTAKQILISELVLSQGKSYEEIEECINSKLK